MPIYCSKGYFLPSFHDRNSGGSEVGTGRVQNGMLMMNQSAITTEVFHGAIIFGAHEVIKHKIFLNKINVFPVADGDTGTNLASLMTTIVQRSQCKTDLPATMRSVADASLIGAKGNSGIIFAQFLNGLSEAIDKDTIANTQQVSLDELAKWSKDAVIYTYKAISEPVEGTIITVMREWAAALERYTQTPRHVIHTFALSFKAARNALKETTQQLPILKTRHVVDSGAQGFVYFIQGIHAYLRLMEEGSTPEIDEATIELPAFEPHDHSEIFEEGKPVFRYCTEALLSGKAIDLEKVRTEIKDLGDSAVIAGRSTQCRIHMHTNTPDILMARLRAHGTLEQQKAEDMLRQYTTAHERASNIALVVDSATDIPQEIIDEHQIHVIPLNLIMEGTTFLDKLTITPKSFYPMLDNIKEYPTTSQPTYSIVEQMFSSLSGHYDSIIALSVSKALSGTFNTIALAAKRVSEQGANIKVVDSCRTSASQGLMALKAAELIKAGKSHEEVVSALEALVPKTNLYVAVETFKYMARSGRISKLAAWLGQASQIKPIISLDDEGKAAVSGKAISHKASLKKLMEIAYKRHQEVGLEGYAVVHANAKDAAEAFGERLRARLGMPPLYVMDVAPVLGLHAGIGCVALAILEK